MGKGSLRVPDLFHRFSRGDHVKLYHCTRYTTAFPHRVPRYGIGAAGAAAEAAGGPGHHGALYPGAGLRGLRGETGALPTDERHAVPHVADERPAVPGVLLAGEALEEALGRRRGRLRPHKAATQRYRVGTTVPQVLQLFLLVQPPGAELGL